MAFKLVPIKTPMIELDAAGNKIRERSIFDMGRIDSEKMYNNIQKLEWRNINSGKIYIDDQSRKNAISLRNNMLRLAETFADENNFEKAEEILDLSLEKMPIEQFDHYSIALGYPEIYYKIGKPEKAQVTANTLIKILQQKLLWYSNYDLKYSTIIIEELQNVLLMYKRGILEEVTLRDKDTVYVKKLQEDFLSLIHI